MKKRIFTSESVTEGHPDKVCDRISDAILDELLRQDPDSRVACETLATTGLVVVSGEITTKGFVEVERIVKETLTDIGYTDVVFGMDNEEVKVITSIHRQSPEIAQGVDTTNSHEQGAGDQGLMFGFACKETPEFMPIPIQLAHKLTHRLAELRKDSTLPWLRPDGKSQVSVEYHDDTPVKVTKVVIATQHDDMLEKLGNEDNEHTFVEKEIIENVIKPVLNKSGLLYDEVFFVNGTGRFVHGGPEADTGLTGRKIIVDTYGGYARHGGGSFSGKDPSKVDRSATYMARYIAKNIVASGLAEKCELQLSYSIGVADPTSVSVDTFGTGIFDDEKLTEIVIKEFPLKPAEIIEYLDLKKPRYYKTSAYGHFGRDDKDFTWEGLEKVETLKSYMNDRIK
ncbi:MAG: methionine adenosyltransferase [Candidatus Marinimicrobia bacterium]|nr:methionine adenosyltransferase [Candidatus Neomarinimicrobiota bacterium]